MILIPSLNNAVIFNGNFLLAQASDDVTNHYVCQVVNVLYPDQLIVIWWITREDVSRRQNLQLPPPVPIDTYCMS
jgi:hypothetical protein